MLHPIDIRANEICKELVEFSKINNDKGMVKELTEKDVKEMLTDYSRASFLSIVDHFTEICTSTKTFDLLMKNEIADASEYIERLLIIENSGNSDLLLKNAEAIIKNNYTPNVVLMAKLIVKKHIITNPRLPFNKKQQLIDKIFKEDNRKKRILRV